VIKSNSKICIVCKGYRRLCGLKRCPLISSTIYRSKAVSMVEKGSVAGSTPPTVIVGESGYPSIRVYLGVPPGVRGDKASFYDNPDQWFGRLGLEDIIDLRSNLVLTATPRLYVYQIPRSLDLDVLLTSVSIKPVDIEVVIEKIIRKSIVLDSIIPPLGPSAIAKAIKVTSNPRIPKPIEKVFEDDLKASEAVLSLYRDGVDFYIITKAFSLGLLGTSRNRKAVPTRWSITAVDKVIGDHLLSSIRSRAPVADIKVFYSEYMYNKYIIIIAPGYYRGLWIEIWHPSSIFNPSATTEYISLEEYALGKYTYMDGGYIAARTSIAEYLFKIGKQAKVVILREILPQYIYTVGSWQIRLNVKNALEKGPILRNPSIEELKNFIEMKTRTPNEVITGILDFVYSIKQKKLDNYYRNH